MRKFVFVLILAMFAIMPVIAQDTPTEIKMWIAFTDDRLTWAQEKAAVFNQAFPQYNVVVEGYSNYEELFVATALSAEQDSLPAIVQYFEVATQVARDSGYFKSIATALGDRSEVNGIAVDFEDFIQPVVSYYTLNGEFTSMPWNTSSAIMYLNQSLLDAAGVETTPTTWAEIEAACEQIMAMEDAPTYCFTWPNHGWFFEQWLAQQNGAFANNDNGRAERATEVAFNSPEGAAILTWLKDMYTKGYLYYGGGQGGSSWEQAAQAFQTQETAIMMYSSSDVAIIEQTASENNFELLTARLPYNQETGWTGNLIGGASLWLVDGLAPEVEDGALTWLLWFSNTENAAEWHQITGYLPIRQSSVDLLSAPGWYEAIETVGASEVWLNNALVQASKDQSWFEANPNFTVAGEQIAAGEITPATSGAIMGDFPAIRNIVTAAIDRVLLTPDADPVAVLNEAAAEANVQLEAYNLLSVGE